jgi:Tol biopolymer transport system component
MRIVRTISLLLISWAAWASAPQLIIFTRIAPVQLGLFISQADGTEERPLLPSGGLDYTPTWSPDGQWIAFTSERNGSADLYRVRTNGAGLERLTDSPALDDQAAFSPDGNQIVFVTTRAGGTADLWILDLRSHKARPLTSGPGGDFRPAWSPDGRWIAFSSDRGSTLPKAKGHWEHLHIVDIYLVQPDGSGLKRITEPGNFCGSPKWTPDSRRIVAVCMSGEDTMAMRGFPAREGFSTRLVSIDIATSQASNLDVPAGVNVAPTVLPSGDIGYLEVRLGGGGASVRYTSGKRGPGAVNRAASWSPDGRHIVYTRTLSPLGALSWQELWSRDPEFRLVSVSGTLPAFDPSGGRFVATRGGDGTDALEVVDAATQESRIVFHDKQRHAVAPQWSPRGDSIIFGLGAFNAVHMQGDFSNGRVDGGAQVATINADGSNFREVTSGANNNGFPSFAPDGKRFVYRTAGPEGQGLRIKNLGGDEVTVLTTDYDNFPLWSPRGDRIVFVRLVQEDFEIFTIRPDGRDLRRLTRSPGNDSHCTWSPDGEWIVFSSTRRGFKDEVIYTWAPQPYGELFMMRYDGSRVRQLTDNKWEDAGPAWQPMKSE